MSDANARRRKPANRYGCKPIEDVCVEHDMPLVCRHGCEGSREHTPCNPRLNDDDVITVCAECLRSACWRGIFMCDESAHASTVERTVAQLRVHQEFGEAAEEHEDYWREALREAKS